MPNTHLKKPCCVCLALCSEIVDDMRSRNKSLFSIFNAVGTQQVPTIQPRLAILASVTNAPADTPVRIVVMTPSGQELFSADGKTIGEDLTSVTDFPLELQGVILPEAGVYAVSLLAGGELIARRHFSVLVGQPNAPAATA